MSFARSGASPIAPIRFRRTTVSSTERCDRVHRQRRPPQTSRHGRDQTGTSDRPAEPVEPARRPTGFLPLLASWCVRRSRQLRTRCPNWWPGFVRPVADHVADRVDRPSDVVTSTARSDAEPQWTCGSPSRSELPQRSPVNGQVAGTSESLAVDSPSAERGGQTQSGCRWISGAGFYDGRSRSRRFRRTERCR